MSEKITTRHPFRKKRNTLLFCSNYITEIHGCQYIGIKRRNSLKTCLEILTSFVKSKKSAHLHVRILELVTGLEPATCWLRISCSTDWAIPANLKKLWAPSAPLAGACRRQYVSHTQNSAHHNTYVPNRINIAHFFLSVNPNLAHPAHIRPCPSPAEVFTPSMNITICIAIKEATKKLLGLHHDF